MGQPNDETEKEVARGRRRKGYILKKKKTARRSCSLAKDSHVMRGERHKDIENGVTAHSKDSLLCQIDNVQYAQTDALSNY